MKIKKYKEQKLSVNSVKQRHKELIFNSLLEHDSSTRTQIAKELSISNATVGTIIDELLLAGFVSETNGEPTGIGRRPNIIQLAADKMLFILMDLRNDKKVSYVVMNIHSKVVFTKSFSVESSYIDSLSSLLASAKTYIEEKDITSSLIGVCVCIPGIFTKESDSISLCTIDALCSINLYRMVKEYFDVTIFIDNDINLATRAYLSSDNVTSSNFLFVYLADGIGSSLVINGELYEGKYGFAGEIGQTRLNDSISLEEKISSKAFLKEISQQFSINSIEDAVALIKEKYYSEDAYAVAILSQIVNALSFSLTNIIWTLTPDIIYISGYLNSMGEKFINDLRSKVYENIPSFLAEITLIEYANDEMLNINLGATNVLLQKWIKNIS